MHRIGYSLMVIATESEAAWSQSLPWHIMDAWLDRVGLVIPNEFAPTHIVVERWCADEVPADYVQTGYSAASFDGTRMLVGGIYEPLPQDVVDAKNRLAMRRADPDVLDIADKISRATDAEIAAWFAANVTDLASARAFLVRLVKYLAARI